MTVCDPSQQTMFCLPHLWLYCLWLVFGWPDIITSNHKLLTLLLIDESTNVIFVLLGLPRRNTLDDPLVWKTSHLWCPRPTTSSWKYFRKSWPSNGMLQPFAVVSIGIAGVWELWNCVIVFVCKSFIFCWPICHFDAIIICPSPDRKSLFGIEHSNIFMH